MSCHSRSALRVTHVGTTGEASPVAVEVDRPATKPQEDEYKFLKSQGKQASQGQFYSRGFDTETDMRAYDDAADGLENSLG